MDRDMIFAAVADERRQIASLIDELDEAQLATPSLCEGWDVKMVAAHLVSVIADSFWAFQRTALRRRGIDRAIDELARRRARLSSAEISTSLRRYADHELSPPITGPRSGLTDVLVHGGDIRVPLGMPFAPAHERVGLALDFLTGSLPLGFVPRAVARNLSARHRRRSDVGHGRRGAGAGIGADDERLRTHRVTQQPRRARRATITTSALHWQTSSVTSAMA
jgi:uncharacterized protein (TIGR03083 family)